MSNKLFHKLPKPSLLLIPLGTLFINCWIFSHDTFAESYIPVFFTFEAAAEIESLVNSTINNASAARETLENIELEIPEISPVKLANITIDVPEPSKYNIIKPETIKESKTSSELETNLKEQEKDTNLKMEAERQRIAAEAERRRQEEALYSGPTVGVYTNAANDTYAYRDYCPQNDGNNLGWGAYFGQFGYTNYYGGYMCECVSYVGYKAYEYWHGRISGGKEAYAPWNVAWGNAISWAWSAAAYGYHVSSTPVAHSVAVWPVGGVGHVQWVEAVDASGGIYISEYNNLGTAPSGMYGDYGEDYWAPYEYQSAGFSFIYFD
ncbi:CHAP domain-containing protein [Candidatus Saccharibacteria bacterium]|nr:CHAP domain-containing protein [Candidatus Saccharibacteria bacterium]